MSSPWKDEESTAPSAPPGGSVEGPRTSKERCKRCGERAAARCMGCGEAFCRKCIDPISKGPISSVCCRECARRLEGTTKHGIPALLEQTLEECLATLATREPTPLVRAMRNEVAICQETIDSWRVRMPPSETLAAVHARVVALMQRIARETA